MNALLISPIVFPLAVALLTLLFWKYHKIQTRINLVSSFLFLLIGISIIYFVLKRGPLTFQTGSWEAPFGITIVIDTFSAIMVLITSILAFVVSIYSLSYLPTIEQSSYSEAGKKIHFGYYPLLNIMYMGVCGAFITGDIFNMYVWFEVMLTSSFILMMIQGTKFQLEGGVKYVTMMLLSSAFFLIGVGFLYALTGTLNMADLHNKVKLVDNKTMITIVSLFFLLAFGIKAAVFPLFFWLPASYHTPLTSIIAIFATLLTKVGVYAIIRVFNLIFTNNIEFTHPLLVWISGFTMIVGVLGAAAHYDMRRILAFHCISQIGYMTLGVALLTKLSNAASIFYIIHYIFVKANLFLISGLVNKLKGDYDIRKIGNLISEYPLVAIMFLISALSLAGMPPLSGFWSKFLIAKAGLEIQHYFIVVVALFVGMLTLFSMLKIWNEAFWKSNPQKISQSLENLFSKNNIYMSASILILNLITLCISFYPEPFFIIAERAASELTNPEQYVKLILK